MKDELIPPGSSANRWKFRMIAEKSWYIYSHMNLMYFVMLILYLPLIWTFHCCISPLTFLSFSWRDDASLSVVLRLECMRATSSGLFSHSLKGLHGFGSQFWCSTLYRYKQTWSEHLRPISFRLHCCEYIQLSDTRALSSWLHFLEGPYHVKLQLLIVISVRMLDVMKSLNSSESLFLYIQFMLSLSCLMQLKSPRKQNPSDVYASNIRCNSFHNSFLFGCKWGAQMLM